MPPVIVGIAAGIAAAGVVSTAAAIAIGIGAAALTYAATPKFDGGSFANEAFTQQQMLRSPVEPRRGIYGRAMVSGPLVFAEETGADNAYLHLVIPLAGHRCDGVEKIYFGDDVAWANGALTSKYASVARLKVHLGNQTTSDPDLTAECRQWTSAHVGFGVTYLYARLKFDTKVFPNGVPNIKALVRGKQVYDPRKNTHNWEEPTTWEWSDNWALCCLDYNRFESGVGAAAHEIDVSYFAAAANDSDQLVEYKTGKFEKRYTCNGTYNQDVSPSSIMEKMLTAGAGMHVYVSGQYRLYAGVYQGPEVLVLTEDDAAGDIDVRPYTPRAELCNAVRGTFVDPENFYQPTDFPPYESSYYRAHDDGEYIDHDLDLPFTQSVWTAQRLGKLYLEQKRAGMQISMPVKMIGVAVSVGKVVGLSLPRLGIDGTFQIVDWQFDYGKPVSLILIETSAELFDYAMGSYTERDLTPNVILPNPATVPTPIGLQYVEYQDDPQWQGQLTWSAPANNSSYRYVIEVSNGLGEVVYQTNADATRSMLPKLDTGFYTVSLWALNLFANRSNVPATLTIGATLPAPVIGIAVIAGPLTLTLRPTTAAQIAQTTQFEILGSITNNIAEAALIGTGKDAVWPDRHPNTRYHVWARTINNYGVSSWYGPVEATTSADNTSIIDLIGNTFKNYTWFAWADDASGTGFTTVEAIGDGKAYMGIATDKDSSSPSGNWQEYTWTKIKTEIPPVFTPEEETKLDNLMAGKLPFAPDKDMLAAQDALSNPALANNLITALSLLNQGISAPALGGETPTGAQSKATAAQNAAASDATTKANNAKAAAETYALAKANLAEVTAKAYADGIVSDEEERAIADATAKANAAQSAAIIAAAADATSKANNAKAQAEANAALDALNKANTAKAEAIISAAADADAKVEAVKVGGVNLFENSANVTFDNLVIEHGYFASIQHVINKLENDEPITISFDVDSVYGNNLHCYNANWAGERVFSPSKIFENFGPDKVRLAFTTKIINNNGVINRPGDTWIEFYSLYGTGDFWKISKLKIERGTKATDWSPAPEDHYDYADAARSAAEAYALAKAQLAETLAKSYADGEISAEETRAIADAQAKADTAKLQAISAAAADATIKANNAQSTAIAAAAADATAKANNAKAQAEANSSLDALNKANAAINNAKLDPELANNLSHGGLTIISRPNGGDYSTYDLVVGAIQIQLPVGYTGTMLSFFVDVFDYRTGYSFSVSISGYNYADGYWVNTTAKILGDNVTNYTVRFGDANGKCCVWIGDVNTWLFYPKVAIRDLKCGHTNYDINLWKSGWLVSQVISFGNVHVTLTNNLIGYADSKEKAEAAQAAAETYALAQANGAQTAAINAVSIGNFAADVGLISTLFANSGLFNQLKSRIGIFGGLTAETIAALAIATNHLQAGAVTVDKVSANAITAEKIAALAVATNHLQAGAVTADKVTADTALIQKLIANVGLFNQLQAQLGIFGGLSANSIAAKAITASKLVVTGGGTINYDPMLLDSEAWSTDVGSISFPELTDAPAGKRVLRSGSGPAYLYDTNYYPIDTTKTYRFRFWARSAPGTNGLLFACLRQFSSMGVVCAGNGGRYPYKPMGVVVPTEWTEYSFQWDSYDWQPEVKYVLLDWLLNYNGSTGYIEICYPRLEEMASAELIVDGAITTQKILSKAITTDKIAANAVTATELLADTALINKLVATSALFDSLAARLAVFGGLTANSIAADAILGRHIKAGEKITSPIIEGGEVRLIGTAFMKVQSATPFGPDGLVEWYGPKILVNGAPDWANIRKSNAITYLAANGDAYFGGSLSAGVLKTGVTNTDKTPYAANSYPVTIGPFGSNGKAKTVVVSFALSAHSQNPTNPTNPTQPQLSWQLQRKIGSGSWATVSSGVFNGTTSADFEAEPPAHWLVRETCWGSFTFTDNTNSTSDFNYRVLVISYSRYHATSNVNTHNLSLISTEQ